MSAPHGFYESMGFIAPQQGANKLTCTEREKLELKKGHSRPKLFNAGIKKGFAIAT